MNKCKEFYKICKADGAIAGWVALLTSVFLIVASLFIPPTGQIHASVIQAVGELFAFAALFKLPNIIQSIADGKALTIQHGSTTVTVASKEENTEEEDGINS